jgi:hypothetical protein
VRLRSAHHRVGPFTVGYPLGLLRALPPVKQLEGLRWQPPGWRVTATRVQVGTVTLVLEKAG